MKILLLRNQLNDRFITLELITNEAISRVK